MDEKTELQQMQLKEERTEVAVSAKNAKRGVSDQARDSSFCISYLNFLFFPQFCRDLRSRNDTIETSRTIIRAAQLHLLPGSRSRSSDQVFFLGS